MKRREFITIISVAGTASLASCCFENVANDNSSKNEDSNSEKDTVVDELAS